jgi:hypothetical protein
MIKQDIGNFAKEHENLKRDKEIKNTKNPKWSRRTLQFFCILNKEGFFTKFEELSRQNVQLIRDTLRQSDRMRDFQKFYAIEPDYQTQQKEIV